VVRVNEANDLVADFWLACERLTQLRVAAQLAPAALPRLGGPDFLREAGVAVARANEEFDRARRALVGALLEARPCPILEAWKRTVVTAPRGTSATSEGPPPAGHGAPGRCPCGAVSAPVTGDVLGAAS
jgi:hypothetical protein